MRQDRIINVFYHDRLVGTAAGIGKDICTEIAYDIEKCVKNELDGN